MQVQTTLTSGLVQTKNFQSCLSRFCKSLFASILYLGYDDTECLRRDMPAVLALVVHEFTVSLAGMHYLLMHAYLILSTCLLVLSSVKFAIDSKKIDTMYVDR